MNEVATASRGAVQPRAQRQPRSSTFTRRARFLTNVTTVSGNAWSGVVLSRTSNHPASAHRSLCSACRTGRRSRDHGRRYSRQERHRGRSRSDELYGGGASSNTRGKAASRRSPRRRLGTKRGGRRQARCDRMRAPPPMLTIEREGWRAKATFRREANGERRRGEQALSQSARIEPAELRCGDRDHFYIEGQDRARDSREGALQVWIFSDPASDRSPVRVHTSSLP